MKKFKNPAVAIPLTTLVLLMAKITKQVKELELLDKTGIARPIDSKNIKFPL